MNRRQRDMQKVREALVTAITARRGTTRETEVATRITAIRAVRQIIDEANVSNNPTLETTFLYYLCADLALFAAWLTEGAFGDVDPDRLLAALGMAVANQADEDGNRP